jgi:hypothetical protein
VGAQFVRHRQFAPAGLCQQAAHLALAAARPGDDGEHLLAHLIEARHQIVGHRQRLAHALERRHRQAADVDRQQAAGAQQAGEVDVEPLQLGKRLLERDQMAAHLVDAHLVFVARQARAPDLTQPFVERFEVGQRGSLGRLGRVDRSGVAALLEQLGQARLRFQPRLPIADRGRLRERLQGARRRIEGAEARERQRGVLRLGRQHQQLHPEQGFGAQHQTASNGVRCRARRMSGAGRPR